MKPHPIISQTCEALAILFNGFPEICDDPNINLDVYYIFDFINLLMKFPFFIYIGETREMAHHKELIFDSN